MQCGGGEQMDAMIRLEITIDCLTDLPRPRVAATQKNKGKSSDKFPLCLSKNEKMLRFVWISTKYTAITGEYMCMYY